MKFYFVGLAMRSYHFDYTPLHAALAAMRAQRVSTRIWLCAVRGSEGQRFEEMHRCLSAADEMLVVEVPPGRPLSARSLLALSDEQVRLPQ